MKFNNELILEIPCSHCGENDYGQSVHNESFSDKICTSCKSNICQDCNGVGKIMTDAGEEIFNFIKKYLELEMTKNDTTRS